MGSDPNCIFCKIIAGQIPCHKVLEDADVLAFLDIGPLAPGHVLVIPKGHYVTIEDAPESVGASLGRALPQLVRVVRNATGAAGVNVLQNNGKAAGQEVLHVHVHLIPRNAGDGLGYRWNPQKYAAGQAEAVLAKLQAELKA
jgi:histidine triad (HIT) family protein